MIFNKYLVPKQPGGWEYQICKHHSPDLERALNFLPSTFHGGLTASKGNCPQKERSPGISPGSVWFRVPREAPGMARRLRWWGGQEGPAGSGTTRIVTGNSVSAL